MEREELPIQPQADETRLVELQLHNAKPSYSGLEHQAWKHVKFEATEHMLRRMHTTLGRPWDGD